ncbi:hypothetical protein [Symbioplanes lichenis]|uniref:hypothetical protein n=1 Tax=Symbioplanes lichenis TaxID=1629072 RepID=UPI002739E6F4|nr:hypothetical protein [Actinoplanes lichenis]
MRLINEIERPSVLLPSSVCAPSASWLPVSPVAVLPVSPAAERAHVAGAHQVSGAYQAPVQAELGQELATVGGGSYGSGISTTGTTTGFKGSNGFDLAMKRRTGDARGVPPRGRPV